MFKNHITVCTYTYINIMHVLMFMLLKNQVDRVKANEQS